MFIEVPEFCKANVIDKVKYYVPKYFKKVFPYFIVLLAGIILAGVFMAV